MNNYVLVLIHSHFLYHFSCHIFVQAGKSLIFGLVVSSISITAYLALGVEASFQMKYLARDQTPRHLSTPLSLLTGHSRSFILASEVSILFCLSTFAALTTLCALENSASDPLSLHLHDFSA